jgi:small subunit ribosomal protein S4
MALSRDHARQMIAHGHVTVGGRKTDASSYLCRPGDVIGFRDRKNTVKQVRGHIAASKGRSKPSWLDVRPDTLEARVLAVPPRGEVSLPVQEQLIVELCSR